MAADNERPDDRGRCLSRGSFSRLMSSDDGGDKSNFRCSSSPFFSLNTPKMLCFEDFLRQNELGFTATTQKWTVTHADFSPASSVGSKNSGFNSSSKSKKKRSGPGQESVEGSRWDAGAPMEGNRNSKKCARESTTSSARQRKVKRERLGEGIAALQLLVSPYGKTDTASVLHEAIGYIRFLQEQVSVLCSPYLQGQPEENHPHDKGENRDREWTKGLRSRGLSLVPVDCIAHITSSNGADLWSPLTINALNP
ncbi:hypothetical protein Nepgr_019995 [Nepenthes gracilis]|uniref:BHLH domain-containing protein n=1 Tax=Nepenthes gracilis TaxID=150966 RepID=A0AAD3SWU6_NEPGR|nr:hypothetical protein Nepgr_019995 [Nepenthes gracilis]